MGVTVNMKKRIRNILIAIISFTGISFLYRMKMRKAGPLVRVLCLHDVPDKAWFSLLVNTVYQNYNVISPQDFIEKKFDTNKINILLTFDDGYQSWVDVALPVLKEKGIDALFFVNSGLVDTYGNAEEQEAYVRNGLKLSRERKTLSWEGVKQLDYSGHTIGGHTSSHKALSTISQEQQVHAEVSKDKKHIEVHVGHQIDLFAYPFGRKSDYNEKVTEIIKNTGYSYAFTTEAKFYTGTENAYTIPRLCLEETLTAKQICQWVDGGYDIVNAFNIS